MFLASKDKLNRWAFWLASLGILTGLVLSVISWLGICIEECSAAQQYRLFGFKFGIIGVVFFSLLLGLHFISLFYPFFSWPVGWMVASAIGAEIMFILIQKYQIGRWCPICLSIALALTTTGIILAFPSLRTFYLTLQQSNRGEIMHTLQKCLSSAFFVIVGFLVAVVGVSKPDLVQAETSNMKNRLVFGSKNSPIEVYFISDWYCPSCKKVEPQIEALLPKVQSNVAFYFVDFPIHTKSLNFCPYNLSFLLSDKNQYLQARRVLVNLTEKTENPTDLEVSKAAQKAGLVYNEASFLDIKAGMDYFDNIVSKYSINSTPTVVIFNTKNKKITKLEGADEISQDKVLKALDQIKI